jgi:hypothetical protein
MTVFCRDVRLLKAELASVREDISVYEENLHVKDGIVKKLTSLLDDLEPPIEPTASSTPNAVRKWNEMEQLRVMLGLCCSITVSGKI